MKLLLLALTLVQAPTCIEEHGGAQAAAKPFYDCVAREARRLERSKEPSRDVAVAAVSNCRPSLVQFRTLLGDCGKTIEAISSITERIREDAQDRAIATIVSIRAAR